MRPREDSLAPRDACRLPTSRVPLGKCILARCLDHPDKRLERFHRRLESRRNERTFGKHPTNPGGDGRRVGASLRGSLFTTCAFVMPITNLVGPIAIPDRKSTRLNSSHLVISYAVFC